MNDSFDIYSEFDLDAVPMEEPVAAIMTSGFDRVPDNYEMIKESAVVNRFNLMLMRHDMFGFRSDVGSWWILIFVAPKSIAEMFSRFYFGNDKDVDLFEVESMEYRSFDDGFIYGDQIMHIPLYTFNQDFYKIVPLKRFEDDHAYFWEAAYKLEEMVKHDNIHFM